MGIDRSTLLRGLAGLLAISAVTPILLLPYTLPAIFRFTAEMLVIGLVLRASTGCFFLKSPDKILREGTSIRRRIK